MQEDALEDEQSEEVKAEEQPEQAKSETDYSQEMDVASELASSDKLNIQDVQQAEGHSIESLLENVDVSESIEGDHTIQEMGS